MLILRNIQSVKKEAREGLAGCRQNRGASRFLVAAGCIEHHAKPG
jgi:hypothetical protein